MSSDRVVVGELDARGVRLSYRVSGDPSGPPVVLLHGSGSDASTWDRFASRLTAAGYRSIALDLRGHATSTRTTDYALTSIRDDVLRLLHVLDLKDVTLVGHSVGGHAAVAAALQVPGRITRLVLEDLAAPPRSPAPMTATGLLSGLAAVAGILTRRRNYHLRAAASIVLQLSHPDPQWWVRLGAIEQPTLILSGGQSSCIPPQRLAEVTAAMPVARLVTIPVGHRVHSLAHDRFAAEVLAFLTEPAASAVRRR